MPDPLVYLRAMVTAAIVSAVFVLVAVAARRTSGPTWLNSACVLGMAFGLALGYHAMSWQFPWPPASGLDRMLTIVLPLALASELSVGVQRVPRWVAWWLRISLAVVVPRILLHGSVYLTGADNQWSPFQAIVGLVACGGLLLAGTWALLARLSQRSPGISIPFALCLAILCAGLTVMLAGYIKGGAAAFPLAATLAATSIGARLSPTRDTAPSILAIGVVGLFSLLFIGRFFGRLSTGSALVMLLAPLLCWATEMRRLPHGKPWLVGSLRLVLVAIPLVLVLAQAKRDFDREMAPLLGKAEAAQALKGCGIAALKSFEIAALKSFEGAALKSFEGAARKGPPSPKLFARIGIHFVASLSRTFWGRGDSNGSPCMDE